MPHKHSLAEQVKVERKFRARRKLYSGLEVIVRHSNCRCLCCSCKAKVGVTNMLTQCLSVDNSRSFVRTSFDPENHCNVCCCLVPLKTGPSRNEVNRPRCRSYDGRLRTGHNTHFVGAVELDISQQLERFVPGKLCEKKEKERREWRPICATLWGVSTHWAFTVAARSLELLASVRRDSYLRELLLQARFWNRALLRPSPDLIHC